MGHVFSRDSFLVFTRVVTGVQAKSEKVLHFGHLSDGLKVLFRTTFGSSQMWFLIRGALTEMNDKIFLALQVRYTKKKRSFSWVFLASKFDCRLIYRRC